MAASDRLRGRGLLLEMAGACSDWRDEESVMRVPHFPQQGFATKRHEEAQDYDSFCAFSWPCSDGLPGFPASWQAVAMKRSTCQGALLAAKVCADGKQSSRSFCAESDGLPAHWGCAYGTV